MGEQRIRLRTIAPGKINWTLEVLGRREDGYHEIRSVMQTIDLCDEVEIREGGSRAKDEGWVRAGSSALLAGGEHEATEDDLTLRAPRALEEAVRRELPVAIRLRKRIPVASGLGGGSSDAAAVLRSLNELYALGMSSERLAAVGARIGSDVPFFLSGGTVLTKGRGERVTPLVDALTAWLVLLVPPIKLPTKTKRMYEALTAEDFNDGSHSEGLSQRLQRAKAVREEDLYNVFENRSYQMFEGLEIYRDALTGAGAEAVHLSGAGPALFTLAESEAAALKLKERIHLPGAKVLVTRTVTAAEATAIVE